MTTHPAIDRSALRARLLAARRDLAEADHRELSDRITAHLLELIGRMKPASLAFYWPHRREYDPRPIAERIVSAGGAVALPVVVAKDRALEFRQWHPDIEMMIGLYEIPYPAGDAALIPEIVLVPTVGFDNAGYRLGYGGGYYDRTLAALQPRPTAIGIGFELGRLESIQPQPHDVPMDLVITEAGVVRPQNG